MEGIENLLAGADLKANLLSRTYLVPYLPVTPTFLVLLVIFAVLCDESWEVYCRVVSLMLEVLNIL